MLNRNDPLNSPEKINPEKRYSLFVGIYFSLLFFSLLLLLIFVNMSVAIQQVIVTVIGVLIIMSFYSFKKAIKPESKKSLTNPYSSYSAAIKALQDTETNSKH